MEAHLCPIWGEVFRMAKKVRHLEINDAYQILLDRVKDHYSPEYLVVDSSKKLLSLEQIARIANLDIMVLYLIKDVRAYVQSCVGLETNVKWRQGSILYRTREWYKVNREIRDYLMASGTNFLQFSYEELCFQPAVILSEIAEFLNISEFPSESNTVKSKSHILRGNLMRFDKIRRSTIRYDNRWFFSGSIQLLTRLWPGAMAWNDANVYSRSGIHGSG